MALLVDKLAKAEANHAAMVAANKVIKRHARAGTDATAELVEVCGISDERAHELLNPRFAYYGQGFPSFSLSNSRGRINQIKERIATLARAEVRRSEAPAEPVEGQRWFEDADSNRVCFEFDGKPCAEVREVLKRNGFRWAPSAGRWQRQATGNGIWAAQRVATELERLESGL
jgi:hypothetical protein